MSPPERFLCSNGQLCELFSCYSINCPCHIHEALTFGVHKIYWYIVNINVPPPPTPSLFIIFFYYRKRKSNTLINVSVTYAMKSSIAYIYTMAKWVTRVLAEQVKSNKRVNVCKLKESWDSNSQTADSVADKQNAFVTATSNQFSEWFCVTHEGQSLYPASIWATYLCMYEVSTRTLIKFVLQF